MSLPAPKTEHLEPTVANSLDRGCSEHGRIWEKVDDVRKADFRLANRRFRPLSHLTAQGKCNGNQDFADRHFALAEATVFRTAASVGRLWPEIGGFCRDRSTTSGHPHREESPVCLRVCPTHRPIGAETKALFDCSTRSVGVDHAGMSKPVTIASHNGNDLKSVGLRIGDDVYRNHRSANNPRDRKVAPARPRSAADHETGRDQD